MLTPECCAMAHICMRVMSIGDGQLHKGQPVWVIGPDGSQRAADFACWRLSWEGGCLPK
jgi:hypothetical protein